MSELKRKIKVAFIKPAGMSAGGTERFMQTISANLPKERFEVDYFYCDAMPYIGGEFKVSETDPLRMDYMRRHNMNLIKFHMKAKDITSPVHPWVDTDFWAVFDENKYDIIQTARAGHKEYPFYKIRHTPIIDSIHLVAGVDNQYNIARVMHLNQWSVNKWTGQGGDRKRTVIIINPIEIPVKNYQDLRSQLGLEGKFVYGFHQRADDHLASEIPLQAYKQIEDQNTGFVILGGSQKYRRWAKELGLKNAHFLPATGDEDEIYRFLKTLNVFAHGRKDGELNSRAMGEGMFFGLPIVSHISENNNGHVPSIGEAGRVVDTLEEYVAEMQRLRQDTGYYNYRSEAAKKRFMSHYAIETNIGQITSVYEDVIKNPFPYPVRRFFYSLHWTQNIRIALAWVYLKVKYKFHVDILKILKLR